MQIGYRKSYADYFLLISEQILNMNIFRRSRLENIFRYYNIDYRINNKLNNQP
jgi:hypothetical protein